jgi:prepilin-type N-terminal cleavage/methylation domain-containing protein
MKTNLQSGFTLVEMLVSIALFAIVMVVCVGALLSLVGANKKAQALESTMNNLNISIDAMVRNLREGSDYNCGNSGAGTQDCTNGGTVIAFTTFTGNRWVYEFAQNGQDNCTTATGTGGCIMRSENGGNFSSLTAPEVSIASMEFYVTGTSPNDYIQPRVIITLKGSAGAANNIKDSTTFHLQATAVQRALDL